MAADQFFTKVGLLLHFDGSNGSTTFTDNSPSPKTATVGGAAQISTTQSEFGGSSLALNGSTSFLTFPDSADWAFGAGDFTLEAWIYRVGNNVEQHICGQWSNATASDNAFLFYVDSSNKLHVSYGSGGTNLGVASAATVPQNAWTHVAAVQVGGVLKLFIGGTLDANTITPVGALNNSTQVLRVGFWLTGGSNSGFFNGYFDDLRITKGVARYTANFTPPVAAFPDDGTRASSFSPVTFGNPVAPHFATSMGTVVHFGTPLTPLPATSLGNVVTFGTPTGFRAQVASSIGNVVTFGTPRLKNIARSWTAVTFGTPATPLPATSIGNVVTFGTPRQQRRSGASSIGKVVTFGTPSTPTNRTCQASSWVAAVFNTPVALIMEPLNLDRTLPAVSLPRGVMFGRPTARAIATGAASSLSPVTFGTPSSRVTPRCQASSVRSVVSFGTPHTAMRTHAHAWDAVIFGTPTSRRVCTASSVPSRVQFGTPSYRRANGHDTHSWLAVRFGQPRARTGLFRAATSLGTVVTFGTPTATQHHRVLPNQSPVVTFGTPLAVRNPRC